MNRYVVIAGGALSAISMFLPFYTILGITIHGTNMGGVGWFLVAISVVIAVVGFVGNRWLHILSLLLGLIIAGLGAKYYMDAKSASDTAGALADASKVGIGLYLMQLGGWISVIGSIWSLTVKKAAGAMA